MRFSDTFNLKGGGRRVKGVHSGQPSAVSDQPKALPCPAAGRALPLGGALRLHGLPEYPERRRDPTSVRGPRREGPARERGSRGEMGSFPKGCKWFHFVRVGLRKWLRLVFLLAGLSAFRTPRPRVAQRAPHGAPPGLDSVSTGDQLLDLLAIRWKPSPSR